MANEKKEKIILSLPLDLATRLEDDANRYGQRSRQQLIEEVLREYLDLWEEAEEARREIVERQRSRVSGERGPQVARKRKSS